MIVALLLALLPVLSTVPPPRMTDGVVVNTDLFSVPNSLSLLTNNRVTVLSIAPTTEIVLDDETTALHYRGALAMIRVGDAVTVTQGFDGALLRLEDHYRTEHGTIVVATPTWIALDSGTMLPLVRSTTVTINGEVATIGALRPGDTVAVRVNPQTNESTEIVARR